MNISRLVVLAAVILFCAITNESQARLMEVLTYQQLLDKSDLVVIATPKTKTIDTKEQEFLPNVVRQDENGKQSKVKSIGVETVFAVSVVFKGDKTIKRFKLHHYREAQSGPSMSGPVLVFFDPSDTSTHSSYLLFLVREPDGRFAPTGGQTDPGYKAINPIPLELN